MKGFRVAAVFAILALLVGTANAATYTWTQGGTPSDWNDPLNWDANGVPPQNASGTEIVFSAFTSGNISSLPSTSDTNKVAVSAVSWSTSFNMEDFGDWRDANEGWIIDADVTTSNARDQTAFTYTNGGFMSNRYGTWNLKNDLVLNGNSTTSGGLKVTAYDGNDGVLGAGGFIVQSGRLQFRDETHGGVNYKYTGGVTVEGTGLVHVDGTSNEALGEGALTVKEGGEARLASNNLANNADIINLVVLSAGAPTATNQTFITGSPTIVSDFYFDLTSVGTPVAGNEWSIVSNTASYSASDFSVNSFTEGTPGVWTGTAGLADYQFTESTGILEVTNVIPEPASVVLLAMALLGMIGLRRRK